MTKLSNHLTRWLLRRPTAAALGLLAPLFGVWLAHISLPGEAQGCTAGCATALSRSEGPLRVMVLNVLHGFPRFVRLRERLDYIAAEIRRRDADLVLLQEVPWIPPLGDGAEYLASSTGLNHLSARHAGNRWTLLFESRLAILSRYPLDNTRLLELQPRASFFEPRVVLSATARTPRGELHLFVTHLTHGDPEVNRAQTAALRSFVATSSLGPALVGGDFNAPPDSPQIQALAQNWVDAFTSARPGDAGSTCCIQRLSAPSAETLQKRIDYLFLVVEPADLLSVRTARRVLDRPFRVEQGWQWASDHAGLLAEIDWPQS